MISRSILNCIRNRRLTYGSLFLSNSLLCYRMETIGDWGQHLEYSPRFWRYSFFDWLPCKSVNDPIFVPFAYAVYWTGHSIMLMSLAPILQRYWTKLTLFQSVLILSLPLDYAFDNNYRGILYIDGLLDLWYAPSHYTSNLANPLFSRPRVWTCNPMAWRWQATSHMAHSPHVRLAQPRRVLGRRATIDKIEYN
jgi:hypothetical protein